MLQGVFFCGFQFLFKVDDFLDILYEEGIDLSVAAYLLHRYACS